MAVTLNALLVAQAFCALILIIRMSRGRTRPPAVQPASGEPPVTPTTIVVATLNEAHRIAPLLAGATLQGTPVVEILIVDSNSSDGTRELVAAASRDDPRIRLTTDPPLPDGWIGKSWALEHARQRAQGTWLLGLDADVVPRPGLAAAVVAVAEHHQYDAVSLSPRFVGQSSLEQWLQPALLTTLVYRFGPGGDSAPPDRVIANGQCFLVRRDVLEKFGGYEPVRASFSEDVSLARHLARNGARVAFLDGSLLYDVKSYESGMEMWRGWGRSIDLKDATTRSRQIADVFFLAMVQGVPMPLVVLAMFGVLQVGAALLSLNAALIGIRVLLGAAMRHSYAQRGVLYWLSPFADPLAAVRVLLSSLRRPTSWRGRVYGAGNGLR